VDADQAVNAWMQKQVKHKTLQTLISHIGKLWHNRNGSKFVGIGKKMRGYISIQV